MKHRTIRMLLTILSISVAILACQFLTPGDRTSEPEETRSTELESEKNGGLLPPLFEGITGKNDKNQQGINIGGTEPIGFSLMGQLGGSTITVTADGDRVFIGQGPRVVALDVSDSQSPTVKGQSPVLPGLVTGLSLEGNTLYAVTMYGGLQILDVSDPTSIKVTGSVTPKTPGCESLVIRDKKAYMACNPNGLFIADITNNKKPEILFNQAKPAGASIAIALVGDYAYMANLTEYTLDIFNIKDPQKVEQLNSFSLDSLPDPEIIKGIIYGVWECGGRLCLAAGQDGLVILDLSDPLNPSLAGRLDTQVASGLFVDGNTVYLADDMEGIHIIDISDYKNPRDVGFIPTQVDGWELTVHESGERGLYMDSGRLYITDQAFGLTIADVSNSENPQRIGQYMTPVPDTLFEIRLDGDMAYLVGRRSGFRVVDVSDPNLPKELAYDDERKNLYLQGPTGLRVRDKYAYISDANYPFHIYKLDNPSQPVQIGALYDATASDGAMDVVLNNNLAYLSGWALDDAFYPGTGLWVVDITDPSNPQALNFVDVPNENWRLVLAKDHLYALDRSIDRRPEGQKEPISLRVFDLSNPKIPSIVNTIVLPGTQNLSPTDMDTDGERLFVRIIPTGVLVYNLTEPENPKLEATMPFPGGMPDIMKEGKYLFLGGMMAYNISDFNKPIFAGQTGSLQSWGAVLDKDIYYVITAFQGLYIFRFNPIK